MSLGETVKTGYLTKSPPGSSGKLRRWQRRWFVLLDSRLSYPLAERYVRIEYYQTEADVKKLVDPKGLHWNNNNNNN